MNERAARPDVSKLPSPLKQFLKSSFRQAININELTRLQSWFG
jgi:hypothetical protein